MSTQSFDDRRNGVEHPLAGLSARAQYELTGTVHFQQTISMDQFGNYVRRNGGVLSRPADSQFGCYAFSGTAFEGEAWFPSEAAARAARLDIIRETCNSGVPEHERCSVSYRG